MSKYADRKSISGQGYARINNSQNFVSFSDSGLSHAAFLSLPQTPEFSPAAWGLKEREINWERWSDDGTRVVASYDAYEHRWVEASVTPSQS